MHPPLIPEKHPLCKEVRSGATTTSRHLQIAPSAFISTCIPAPIPAYLQQLTLCSVQQYIEALVRCHSEHSISKWWGACNDAKFDLTRCLQQEKTILR